MRFANLLFIIVILISCKSTTIPKLIEDKSLENEISRKDIQNNKSLPNIHNEVTITELHNMYSSKTSTVTEVVDWYLNRIDDLNPKLNAVITVNPKVRDIAKSLDAQQMDLSSKPLFGIPILLKDNIDTGDDMPTTVGSRIMANSYPANDSPTAAQLREAGAIILGKANLSEWANFHSLESSSGWSGVGGQTNNPYDVTRNPCGSSAGSGVAVAANLCVIAIGTETNGSIVCPSNNNGIVGIKPTVGLLSRSGIVPISFTQDTPGPMARTVSDAVIALGTMTKQDSSDLKTLQQDRKALSNYSSFLNENGLQGKRIGIWKGNTSEHPLVEQLIEKAAEDCKRMGAEIIELETVVQREANRHSFQVLLYEFKDGLNTYFESLGENSPVQNLTELYRKTRRDSIEMEYHDFSIFKIAMKKGDLKEEEYLKARKKAAILSKSQGIDKQMDLHNLDAIISAAGGPAWKTDLVNGDNFGLSSSSPAAISGYPNICVPMGQIQGLPVGMNIFGRKWSEDVLIEIAYGYEQATKHRFSPDLN